jgi:Peroxidase, family 2
MTRNDYYFGDNHDLNKTLLAALIAASSDGNTLTEDDFANYQSMRQNYSQMYNPDYTFGLSQKV